MFSIFTCTHPLKYLAVQKESSEVKLDEDFSKVTHHLRCTKCSKDVSISFAKLNGGVTEFLNRGLHK